MKQDYTLWNLAKEFVRENKITCAEAIYQCDWVSENALEFIEKVCEAVGYEEEPE